MPEDKYHYTKSIEHFQDALLSLYNGRFLSQYKMQINQWFFNKYKYYINDENDNLIRECKGSWHNISTLIMKVTERYAKWFRAGTEIEDKNKLPRDFMGFIFNGHTQTSMFYICLTKSPTSIRESHAEMVYESLPESIIRETAYWQGNADGFTFWSRIKSVLDWRKRYAKELMMLDSGCVYFLGTEDNFIKEYKVFISDLTNNAPSINNLGTDNKTFTLFLNQARKDHGIDIKLPNK
jgi:hypothetical protein